LIGWSISLAVLVGFTLAFYPSIKGNESYDDLLKDMPEALQSFVGTQGLTSPAGYLESQIYIFMLPLLFLIFEIGRGAASIAGEERIGTLDLLLANPIARGRVVLEKFGTLVVSMFVLGVVFFLVLLLGVLALDMDVGLRNLIMPTVGTTLLGIFFGTLSLSVGALTGKKGTAAAVSALVAVVAYFLNSLAPFIEALEPLRVVSPFYWALGESPVGDPVPLLRLIYVIAATMLVLVVGIFRFDRRDLGT
jgi:ABC-2 type transport system permease protein